MCLISFLDLCWESVTFDLYAISVFLACCIIISFFFFFLCNKLLSSSQLKTPKMYTLTVLVDQESGLTSLKSSGWQGLDLL